MEEKQLALFEPELCHPLFVTGIEVEVGDVMRLTAWVDIPDQQERRIVARLVMTQAAAQKFMEGVKSPAMLQ